MTQHSRLRWDTFNQQDGGQSILSFTARMTSRRRISNAIIAWLMLLLMAQALDRVEARTTMSSYSVLSAPPISLSRHGWNKFVTHRWNKAKELSELEQQVEDYNAEWIATSQSSAQAVRHRRLICLPLDETLFDPPMGVFSHGHVQTGDKMSLPSNFWNAIQYNNAEVPWLFAVKRIDGVTSQRVELVTSTSKNEEQTDSANKTTKTSSTLITPHVPLKELDRVVGGPLDFRAPNSYVFLPLWMMRALGLRPRDIVEVELIETVPPGSLAKLRPHSSDFAKEIANPQAVLETELRHYSALCQGSTIAFDYNSKRYWFDVVELRSAPRGEKVPMIKVQDCDIATDFLVAKDALKKKKKP